MQWLRALSESDCYLRCHGERAGTVHLVGRAPDRHDPSTEALLQRNSDSLSTDAGDERQAERPVEAA